MFPIFPIAASARRSVAGRSGNPRFPPGRCGTNLWIMSNKSLVLISAILGVMALVTWAASAKPGKLKAIGGTPNALLARLASAGGEPHVFKEDAVAAKAAPAEPVLDDAGKPQKPKRVVPVNYNENCWAASLDVSGIPWHTGISGAVISRRHIVTAAHWNDLPHKMDFQTREGERVTARLIRANPEAHPNFDPTRQTRPDVRSCWIDLGNDVAIATTAEPLPDSIPHYPLPKPLDDATAEHLTGRSVLSTSWSSDHHQPDPRGVRVLGLRRISRINGATLAFARDPALPADLYFDAVIGDSGNPLFLVRPASGALILASTFSGGGSGSGPFYGDARVQENIREYIAASPAPHERFTTFDLETED